MIGMTYRATLGEALPWHPGALPVCRWSSAGTALVGRGCAPRSMRRRTLASRGDGWGGSWRLGGAWRWRMRWNYESWWISMDGFGHFLWLRIWDGCVVWHSLASESIFWEVQKNVYVHPPQIKQKTLRSTRFYVILAGEPLIFLVEKHLQLH